MKKYKSAVLAALLAGACIAEAGASVIFSNRASFNSATHGTSLATFEGYDGIAQNLGMETSEDGIHFSSSRFDLYSLHPFNYDLFGTGRALWTTSISTLTGTGPGAFRAFGIDLRSVYKDIPSDFSIAFSNGAQYDLHSDGTPLFFGILLDEAATSFRIRTLNFTAGTIYDNVALDSVALPLPGTLPLMGAGLVLLAYHRRVRRNG